MTPFSKFARWIPIVGIVLEIWSRYKYLSVHDNNVVWGFAFVWHWGAVTLAAGFACCCWP